MSHAAFGARRWRRATRRVAQSQEQVLTRILRANAGTEFGREHGVGSVRSVGDFRRRVPVRTSDEVAPWIERVAGGEPNVLTAAPVTRFGVTSGSSAASKLVPYTRALLEEFQTGIAPWAFYMFRRRPQLLSGTSYWSITPVAARETHTRGGIPVGFEDERRYLGRAGRWVAETSMPMPSAVSRIEEIDRFRYVTLRLLLEQESLAWVSVWNPTFLTLLMDPLVGWHERLLADLEAGTISADGVAPEVLARARARPARARALRAVFAGRIEDGSTVYEAVWPRLALISCWADAAAAEALPVLRKQFPNAAIQRKGLVATEAFVSFPLTDDTSALSLGSHFFEFCETEPRDRVLLAHELELGQTYSVVVTTGGGLYRYRLGDLVIVVGFEAGCPLLRFVGREGVVDLRGEKLNDAFVHECVRSVLGRRGLEAVFWLVAPCRDDGDAVSYALFLELEPAHDHSARLEGLDAELDRELRRGYHYDYCRRLAQLGQCRLFAIDSGANAWSRYLARRVELGQRLGDVKPAALDGFDGWHRLLPGRFV